MDIPPLLLRSHHELFSAVAAGDIDTVRRLFPIPTANEPPAAAASAAEVGGGDDPRTASIDGGGDHLSFLRAQNDAGLTVIHIAAQNNMEEILRHLLSFCDSDIAAIRSKDGRRTAFQLAAREGHLGIVKEFLARWPEICKMCDATNTSPVYDAAVRDHLDVVNAILDVDPASIRIVRKNGKTALHVAARRGHYRIVKVLIDRDPSIVPIADKKGQTALHMAVKGQNTEVVEEMLSVDISILNARDKKGNTALHVATRKWRHEMVCYLLNYAAIEVNAINNQSETALDLAEKIPYDKFGPEIMDSLREAGARNARNVGKLDEASELRKTVIDIKHDVQSQLKQNAKTNKRVTGIAKELRKLHREAVQNTINSVTVVAVLVASIAFVAIFNLPGQYLQLQDGSEVGRAHIADTVGFRAFCLLNATALFLSLAVVVVQITLVAWETGAQELVVSIVNKLMWAACICTCAAFLSIAFVVVGKDALWMAITITLIGGPMMVGTLGIMCYLVFRQYFKFNDDSQRRIRRGGGSKSFSMSLRSTPSDPDAMYSDQEKIYAL